jgi:Protein of unknown function (DUF3300)
MRTRRTVSLLMGLLLSAAVLQPAAHAQDQQQYPPPDQSGQQDQQQYPQDQYPQDQYPQGGAAPAYQNFSPEQLDNLLAPIALYPDPLLAQVLVAATFPDQIDQASRFLRAGASPDAIDTQPLDVSVKSVAHYPTVLYMMDNRLDWTTSLGQAYVSQSTDVQASIQRLRGLAYNAGTLQSGPQIQVVQQGPYWAIWPVQPQFIYVPVYDPAIVFIGRPGFYGPFITFGVGYPIGSWLIYDFRWGGAGVYYFGWGGGLPVWAVRARPYVRINPIYVNARYNTVVVNRTVVNRTVNVENLNRYNAVHRNVTYANAGRTYGTRPGAGTPPRTVNNQVIQRNINTNDARIQDFRGREGPGPAMTMSGQGRPAPTEQVRPAPAQNDAPRTPPAEARPQVRPAPAPQSSAFDVERQSSFDPRQSSQQGQASRQAMSRPSPQPSQPSRQSSPPPRESSGSSGGGKRP